MLGEWWTACVTAECPRTCPSAAGTARSVSGSPCPTAARRSGTPTAPRAWRRRCCATACWSGSSRTIPGSEDFTEEQVIDAIARTDYDQPIARQRAVAPPPAAPLPMEGGFFRRLRDGFR